MQSNDLAHLPLPRARLPYAPSEPFNNHGLNQKEEIEKKLKTVEQFEADYPEYKGLTALLARDKSMAADPKRTLTDPESAAYKQMLDNLKRAGKSAHVGLAKIVDLGDPKELKTLMGRLAETYITKGKDSKYNLVTERGSLTTMTNVAHYLKGKLEGKTENLTRSGIEFKGPNVRL